MILGDCHEIQETVQPLDNGPWVVCKSMLEPAERMDLLLNAVGRSSLNWRLLICVPSASDVYRQAVENRIKRLGLEGRVVLYKGPLTTSVLTESSGYIALHFASTRVPESAARAVKTQVPIVTASDCGALLEVVDHNTNGLVAEPTAEKIALAVEKLVSDQKYRQRLSSGSRSFGGITNDVAAVVERLVG